MDKPDYEGPVRCVLGPGGPGGRPVGNAKGPPPLRSRAVRPGNSLAVPLRLCGQSQRLRTALNALVLLAHVRSYRVGGGGVPSQPISACGDHRHARGVRGPGSVEHGREPPGLPDELHAGPERRLPVPGRHYEMADTRASGAGVHGGSVRRMVLPALLPARVHPDDGVQLGAGGGLCRLRVHRHRQRPGGKDPGPDCYPGCSGDAGTGGRVDGQER